MARNRGRRCINWSALSINRLGSRVAFFCAQKHRRQRCWIAFEFPIGSLDQLLYWEGDLQDQLGPTSIAANSMLLQRPLILPSFATSILIRSQTAHDASENQEDPGMPGYRRGALCAMSATRVPLRVSNCGIIFEVSFLTSQSSGHTTRPRAQAVPISRNPPR